MLCDWCVIGGMLSAQSQRAAQSFGTPALHMAGHYACCLSRLKHSLVQDISSCTVMSEACEASNQSVCQSCSGLLHIGVQHCIGCQSVYCGV